MVSNVCAGCMDLLKKIILWECDSGLVVKCINVLVCVFIVLRAVVLNTADAYCTDIRVSQYVYICMVIIFVFLYLCLYSCECVCVVHVCVRFYFCSVSVYPCMFVLMCLSVHVLV